MDLVIASGIERFQVYRVTLNPTRGAEMRKTRPAAIISPDELNRSLSTVIIAPMTTTVRQWPCRVVISFNGKEGELALDQLRTIDQTRCREHLGRLDEQAACQITERLQAMFAR